MATPAPAPTSASSITGRPSMPSRWCRAMACITDAAAGRCRTVRHAVTRRRSASRRWAGRRWCGRAPICCWRRPRSARAFPIRSALPAAPPSRKSPKVAPDVFWLQLYRFYQNDHDIGFDLIERAHAAGVKVLALTIDVPVRTTRSRESYAGLGREFRPNAAHALRNGDAAEMAVGVAAPRLSALCHHPPIRRPATQAPTR